MARSNAQDHSTLGSSEVAYQRIRAAIMTGTFKPGDRLNEVRISDEFELSRTPIREALRRLEAEGLVEIVRHRGAVVKPFTPQDVHDLYVLRQQLEALAAAQASARRSEVDLLRMDEALDRYDEFVEDTGLTPDQRAARVEQANIDFHRAVVGASGNHRLAHLVLTVFEPPPHMQSLRLMSTDQLRVVAVFHRLLRDAIAGADAARAERLMIEHLAYGRDIVMADEVDSATQSGYTFGA